jgi:hypothetical protein
MGRKMNERIRAIYNQCLVQQNIDTPNIGFDFEKFAELIVRECAKRVDYLGIETRRTR